MSTSGRFQDRVVLITGGSSGIGATTAALFVGEGAKVYVVDLEERDIITRLGSSNATFRKGDVSSPEDCAAAVQDCAHTYGRIDVLFHNAGIMSPPAKVPDQDVMIFQKVLLTNFGGLFYLSRAAIPIMQKQGSGSIIATASTTALGGSMTIAPYGASKAAIVSLVKTMALDHAKEGIRVNCVLPGMTETPMTAPFAQMPALKAELVGKIPMGCFGEPEGVGKAVLFLASDEASYITGHGLVIDGGTSIDCSGAPDVVKHMQTLQG